MLALPSPRTSAEGTGRPSNGPRGSSRRHTPSLLLCSVLQKGVGGKRGGVGWFVPFEMLYRHMARPPGSISRIWQLTKSTFARRPCLLSFSRVLTERPLLSFFFAVAGVRTRQLVIVPGLRMRIWLDQALFNGGGQGWLHKRFATRTINLISFCFWSFSRLSISLSAFVLTEPSPNRTLYASATGPVTFSDIITTSSPHNLNSSLTASASVPFCTWDGHCLGE